MQYATCHHVKEDGIYCGSPALRDRKYCYYHLMQRARRLRRARALRDNQPYRLEIQSLDNPYAISIALSDISQAIASGQLEALAAGKLLYAIQLASSTNRRIEKMEAEAAKHEPQTDDSRIQEYPDFEEKLGLPPDVDLDTVISAVEQKADEEAAIRRSQSLPEPPPGVRPGSPAYRLFREETYQTLRCEIDILRRQLRDYTEEKRQQIETMKKEVMSATPPPQRRADTA